MALNYKNELLIIKPKTSVFNLMRDTSNVRHWMPGLLSTEVVEGAPGDIGSTSILKFQMGNKIMSMKEKIISVEEGNAMVLEYSSPMAVNRVAKSIFDNGDGTTLYVMENTFHFKGLMRIFAPLMKKTFMKTSVGYMERFKAFVESQSV